MNLENVALHVPEILLPRTGTDLTRWSVVACDQFTSQPEYWKQVDDLVGPSPSTLRLIYPEAFLNTTDQDRYLSDIRASMEAYLGEGTLTPLKHGFVLIERVTARGTLRRGLLVCLDLERYDFREGSTCLIRATEGTVMERLPVRVKIRSRATMELPHIMVLIDDPEMTVIEPLFGQRLTKLYDFELMMNGGRIRGYHVDHPRTIDSVAKGLARLAEPARFNDRYGVRNADVLLYAVGDGNHSLASAKLFWEELKALSADKTAVMSHPARFALVELVNVHDRGLEFEPIHRVLFNATPGKVFAAMDDFFSPKDSQVSIIPEGDPLPLEEKHAQAIEFLSPAGNGHILIRNPRWNLEVGSLQAFLDAYCRENRDVEMDYIHGDDVLRGLSSRPSAMGFLLPVLSKHDLFKTIILEGVLPRKAFSMGHADEKRYYVECRKIVP
ncbi:MAG: DUF1015 domain-containing protein [Desulfobacterota bacterium]|jgi:hypothetical protein|nr:DUF1015 domain-containing protein [Thermodesulfobacteriota bacterium]